MYIIEQLRLAHEQALSKLVHDKEFTSVNEYKLQKKYFAEIDSFLESNLNEPYWLKNPEVAKVVDDSLKHLGSNDIHLYCFTIMSNHVHALFSINDIDIDLYKIMQSHKSFTAKKANAILQHTGHFWEAESYDHIVRDGEFDKIVNYILLNPVKAGLVKQWEDWKWTYLDKELR